MACIVREAVAAWLGHDDESPGIPIGSDPADRLIGSVTVGADDESVNHDAYCTAGRRRGAMKLFVDTGALLALAMRRDRHHPAALAFLKKHLHARLVLTDLVLAEVATRLRARTSAPLAASVVRDLLNSRRYETVSLGHDLLAAAIVKMEQFDDKRLSLTDCASFAVMDQLGLGTAFCFDADFRDCGYRMVP